MKSIQRNQGGFSLVEILLVLGIIAILAIAAFIIFPQVQASNRANTELTNITTIAAGTKNLFGATRDYQPVDTGVVNQAHIFPASMNGGVYTSSADVQSSWNGAVAVANDDCAGGDVAVGTAARCFKITYSAVPSEVCSKLVPGLVQNFKLIKAGVAGSEGNVTDPASIVSACAAADTVSLILISE